MSFYIGVIMSNLKHKRIVNRKIINLMRSNTCEYCGRQCNIEPHHVFSRGSGGGDIKENLIQLCSQCHINTHAGRMPNKEECISIIGKREHLYAGEVYRINRKAMGYEVGENKKET